MKERTQEITAELPNLNEPRSGYESLVEGIEVKIILTEEQEEMIDQVARHYDIKWWAAFDMVWNDAFKMLKAQHESVAPYVELPIFKKKKTKVVG
jgi:hypothetical protein